MLENCGYTLKKVIGSGSSADVYSVDIANTNTTGALKILSSDEDGYNNLLDIDIPCRFKHPHIIQKIDLITKYGCDFDKIGIVNVKGDYTFYKHKFKNNEELIMYMYKLAKGLSFLHDNNIVHLDFKPQNIVVFCGEPQIIDFGSAYIMCDPDVSMTTEMVLVTVTVRPPELEFDRKKYGTFTDVWSYVFTMFSAACNNNYLAFSNYVIDMQYETVLNINAINKDFGVNKERTIRKYIKHEPLVNFFMEAIQIDEKRRPSMREILNMPLFDTLRKALVIEGKIEDEINMDDLVYPSNFSNLVQIMFYIYKTSCSNSMGHFVFYSLDILHRMSKNVEIKQLASEQLIIDWSSTVAACILMVVNIAANNSSKVSMYTVIEEMEKVLGVKLNNEKVLNAQDMIIYHLKGVLFNSHILNFCRTKDELIEMIELIFSKKYDNKNYFYLNRKDLRNVDNSQNTKKCLSVRQLLTRFEYNLQT